MLEANRVIWMVTLSSLFEKVDALAVWDVYGWSRATVYRQTAHSHSASGAKLRRYTEAEDRLH